MVTASLFCRYNYASTDIPSYSFLIPPCLRKSRGLTATGRGSVLRTVKH